ncbi:MAG: CD1845 family protein [Oscillospiraceae bacterium]
MRLILKLIAAPLILLLTVLVAVLLFLFSCVLLPPDGGLGHHGLLGVGLFFISYPVGGVIYLGIAFLLSPYGLQAVAGAVITGLEQPEPVPAPVHHKLISLGPSLCLEVHDATAALHGPPFSTKGGIFSGNDHLTATPRQRGREHSRGHP